MTCGNCGRENAPDARFCDNCGAPLGAAPGADTRKVVTVLFTDVVDSTALGERLDPETAREVMSRWFEAAEEILGRYGATVEKFIGDAVMAVFGVPVVHEDDRVRAVRAACDLRDALDRLNSDLERDQGVRLATRTGVNTGEVVVGGSAGGQRLATGDAVNVAARLQTAAGPGEVLIGRETVEAVREAVVVEAVGAVEAKGKTAAVQAWRVLRPRPDVPAFGRPIATPFVGREHELDLLRRAFDDAVEAHECGLATVVGTPGIGKSRLARELLASLEREARVLIGRCTPYGQDIPYLPLSDVVRDVAGDDPEPELRKLLADETGAAAARLVAGAVGAGDDGGSADETAWAFRRLLEALAADGPVVLVVDDIHWADGALLDLLEYVAGFSSGAPLFLLCLARPDLLEVRPSWAAPHPRTTVLALDPLDEGAAERLVDDLGGESRLAEPVRRRIVESAEGNPLFVEQMLAMLADDPEAADSAIPATIHALLAARIDRLEAAERDVLQHAAVEGRLFHRGAVNDLLAAPDAGLGTTLLALTRKEFVRPDRSLFPGDDAFRFNHVLIRDVAYASLPKRLRATLHARLADWLEARAERLTGADQLVGFHLEQAFRHLSELGPVGGAARETAARGGSLLARAGRRALDRQEPASAAALLARAARLLEVVPAERLLLLPDLGRALRESGRLDEAEPVLSEAALAARAQGDEASECRAEIERARLAFMRATPSPDELRALARRSIEVFEAAGSDAQLADAWQLMGIAEMAAGDRGAQLEAMQRAREHAVAAGDIRRQIDAWNEVGGSMLFGRTTVEETLAFLAEELAWGP